MTKHKMGVAQLNRWGIGPVILHEKIFVFKEIYADQEVIVSLRQFLESSEDASIYQFTHKVLFCQTAHIVQLQKQREFGVQMTLTNKTTTPPDVIFWW